MIQPPILVFPGAADWVFNVDDTMLFEYAQRGSLYKALVVLRRSKTRPQPNPHNLTCYGTL
jgi:hypothetical protein